MNKAKLRILHISDLHEGRDTGTKRWRLVRVLGNEWNRNLDAYLEDGQVDVVCFTGDAAFSGGSRGFGGATEYEKAGAFFRTTLQHLGLTQERFFIVPGNHDVDQSINKKSWQELREKIPKADEREVAEWLAGGGAPIGLTDDLRDSVLLRQKAYREWLKSFGRAELLPDPLRHPNLGYRFTLRFPGHTFDTHIIGLDSAWLAGDENDAGKLRLTDEQIGRLLVDNDGAPLHGFKLALMHHPFGDIADGERNRKLLANYGVGVVLRGHRHETQPSSWSDPDQELREIGVGCLYEHDRWQNGCHLIEIEFDQKGWPQTYAFHFRSWSENGFWHPSNQIYREAREGRLIWHSAGSISTSSSPTGEAAYIYNQIELLVQEVRALNRIDMCSKEAILNGLKLAAIEAARPDPNGGLLQSQIQSAARTLETIGGACQQSRDLATKLRGLAVRARNAK